MIHAARGRPARLRLSRAGLALFILAGACAAWAAEPGASPPPAERIERLSNGLRVAVIERHLGGVAAFRIYLGAGSLNEGDLAGTGVSHLLEHVLSGGSTPTRSEDDIRKALRAIGAETNAYTSKQYVCYHGQAAAEHLNTLIDIISDYVMNNRVDEKEFAREFEVVQRELERAEADPGRALWQLADENFFVAHPARHPVLGRLDLLRGLTRDDTYRYYRRVASPDNAVAVAVGDFDAAAVFETIRKTMGAWARVRAAPTVLPDRIPQTGPRFAARRMQVAAVRRLLEFPSVQLTHPDLYPLDILAFVLGEGRASRLVADLEEARALVQSVACYSFTPAGYDGGRFALYLLSDPEKADEARARALEHLARIAREGITAEELARAKRQKISEHVFGLESCEDIAEDAGSNLLLLGDARFSQRYVRNIQKVTAADVKRVAAAYLKPEVLCETVVRPQGPPAPKAPAPVAARGGPAPRPEIAKRVLPNGARLLLAPIEGCPSVSIQMVVKGGLSVESESSAGISQFLGRMLLKGTARTSARDLARTLDALGAEMNASSGRNTMYLSARCLAADFEKTFALAADAFTAPALPPEEIEKVRSQVLAELEQLQDTPHGEANLFFHRTFFADSPYRFPVQGTPEVVGRLKRDDLAAWHKRLVAGGNLVVAIFGGVDAARAERLAAEALARVPKDTDLEFPRDIPPPKVQARQVHVKATEKKTAVVYVAYPAFDLLNLRDRFPMDVLDTVLSGYRMPEGWLHEGLRGKGLVYEVHAYTLAGLRPGYFAAYAVCQPEKAAEVVRIIEAAMARAHSEAFSEQAIAPARATIITSQELGRETVAGWSFEAAIDECLGLGYGFAREEIGRIRQVKPEDVARVAREYLKAPVICILTSDPKAVEPPAK